MSLVEGAIVEIVDYLLNSAIFRSNDDIFLEDFIFELLPGHSEGSCPQVVALLCEGAVKLSFLMFRLHNGKIDKCNEFEQI